MRGKVFAYLMIAIGIIGLVFVYSLRPPSGFGDVFVRASQGQDFFLKEPVYYLGLIGFAILTAFGLLKAVRAN